jgi:hypothetical protein
LSQHQLAATTRIDAKKQTITAAQVTASLPGVKQVYSTKGKKVLHATVGAGGLDSVEMQALLIGPSGNLRAPTLQTGDTLLVGFDAEIYAQILL